MDIRRYRNPDEAAVVHLWEECDLVRPWNDPHKDILRKLTTQPELFLIGSIEGDPPLLFRNLGNGTFQNVTGASGINYDRSTF